MDRGYLGLHTSFPVLTRFIEPLKIQEELTLLLKLRLMVVNQPAFRHSALLRYLQSCAVFRLFAHGKIVQACV